MASLSIKAKEVIERYKKYLRENNLTEFYENIRYYDNDIKTEISEFLISILGDLDVFKHLNNVPDEFMAKAKNINSINITDNIYKIGSLAFADSTINSISIGNGVEIIEPKAFMNCTNLKSVDLGSVKIIKDNAFNGCTSLKELYLPETVQMLGKNVFPENVIIKSPPRKAKSLRFPKNELDWYKKHLILDKRDEEGDIE